MRIKKMNYKMTEKKYWIIGVINSIIIILMMIFKAMPVILGIIAIIAANTSVLYYLYNIYKKYQAKQKLMLEILDLYMTYKVKTISDFRRALILSNLPCYLQSRKSIEYREFQRPFPSTSRDFSCGYLKGMHDMARMFGISEEELSKVYLEEKKNTSQILHMV